MRKVFLFTVALLISISQVDGGVGVHFRPCDIMTVQDVDEWQLLIKALIHVESRGNSRAVGSCDDVGVLQITPIYLREVNRICGEERYVLEDRYDSTKSVEMFNIYQQHHNKKADIVRAARLHNPKAGSKYVDSVMFHYNRIKEECSF